jgi:hypothetical protein
VNVAADGGHAWLVKYDRLGALAFVDLEGELFDTENE